MTRTKKKSPGSKQPSSTQTAHKSARQRQRTEKFIQQAKQRQATRIQARTALMQTRSMNIHDLRHVDSHELGNHRNPIESEHASRDFRVLFSTGFLGYSPCTKSCTKLVQVETFNSVTSLAEILTKLLHSQFQSVLGLQPESFELAGYEICFPDDFICGELVIRAGQIVLVQSEYILSAWADQVYKTWRSKPPELVVRIVKPGGALFDLTFRTPKELSKADPREYLTQPLLGSSMAQEMIKAIADEKERARRRTEEILRRRAEIRLKQRAQADIDTSFIERMMDRQQLSEDPEDGGVRITPAPQNNTKELHPTDSQPSPESHLTQRNEMDLD